MSLTQRMVVFENLVFKNDNDATNIQRQNSSESDLSLSKLDLNQEYSLTINESQQMSTTNKLTRFRMIFSFCCFCLK